VYGSSLQHGTPWVRFIWINVLSELVCLFVCVLGEDVFVMWHSTNKLELFSKYLHDSLIKCYFFFFLSHIFWNIVHFWKK